MPIAFDNASDVWIGGSPSGSYINNGDILFAFIVGDVNNDNVTGVTYNGVAMTLIDKGNQGTDRYVYLYYLLNPATGSNTLAATGTPDPLTGYAMSYSGAKQTSQPDAYGQAETAGATSLAKSITVVAENSWMVGCLFSSTGAYTAQAGTTIRDRDPADPNTNRAVFDSNGALAAGSRSLGIDFSASESAFMIVASFAPAPVASGGLMLNFS